MKEKITMKNINYLIPKWLACSRCKGTLRYRIDDYSDGVEPYEDGVVYVDCCRCD